MLWLIGIGIHGFKGLSLYAIDTLKNADIILLEKYTTPIEEDLKILEDIISKEVKKVNRWYIEDGREILELAKSKNIALLAYGDPLIATTHIDLVIRAREANIDVKTIHNASAITAIIGEVGLHIYKLGKISTMVRDKNANRSIYKV
ncbi:MAG: diphthine synthase, partial [Candidatus Nitrosothermus koennekii]